jgi:16S rRNA (cytosine1402-N4)-methyltransferase
MPLAAHGGGELSVFAHATVLRDETVAAIACGVDRVAPSAGPLWVVDCTLGGGGHSEALLARLPHVAVLGLDRDPAALQAATTRLAPFGDRFAGEHATFAELPMVLARRGIGCCAGMLADLGVSSHQFDTPARGFSLRHEGPLDMRMDPSRGPTALDLLATVRLEDLADILYAYGDITRSIGTARILLEEVQRGATTTAALAGRLAARLGHAPGKAIHPATQVFQALRIWVNGELDQLERLLADAPPLIAAGGALAIISFHSGEDRMVKQHFGQLARRGTPWQLPQRKPQVASAQELQRNPRARSAKLRVVQRKTEAELAHATTYAARFQAEAEDDEEGLQ